ncbi:succinyl-diaminopimelate desuccinylase [Halobacteriales archaeon QS_1_68_20]|nr:MAG: succinyl-diaminopimelate desuccinylase [Halobacteriales archaeon QS_1_68_20]
MTDAGPVDPVAFLERAVPVDTTGAVGGLRDLLNTHLDTVPPHLPYERDPDRIRGRGACDAKGPLAAMLAAFLGSDPDGRVTLAVTPDEETGSTGAAALVEGGRPDDADHVIVGEPTGLDVCNAARGRFQATVVLVGENAHAAEPQEGVNAVAAAAPVLEALATYDDRPDVPGPHDAFGPATLTPTVVDGGDATNQVPATCRIVVDRRSVPPETAQEFRDGLQRHLRTEVSGAAAVADAAEVRVALAARETPFLAAFETPADAAVVGALQDAGAGEVRPFGAATEASYFADVAPTVVFGPGVLADDEGPVAHADREYVRVDEVRQAAEVLEGTLDAL